MTSLFRWPVGWDPLGTLRYVQREMDRLMARGPLGESQRLVGGGTYPPVNVLNGPDDILVQCEVAGVKREDLELSITGETLAIKGVKNPPQGDKVRYHRQERGFGEFHRTIVLPDKVDCQRVEAALEAGILAIRLPKAEAAKPKQIQVK